MACVLNTTSSSSSSKPLPKNFDDVNFPFQTLLRTTQDKLSQFLSQKLIDCWKTILQKAHECHYLQRFDEEVLSRLDPSLFVHNTTVDGLIKIFSSKQELMDLFLHLATSFQNDYYTKDEFRTLLENFLQFINTCEKLPLHINGDKVPCYNAGGAEWLTSALRSQSLADAAQKRLKIFDFFSSATTQKPSNHFISRKSVTNRLDEPLLQLLKNKGLFANGLIEDALADEHFSQAECIYFLQILVKLHPSQPHTLLYWLKTVRQTLGDAVCALLLNPASYQEETSLHDVIRLLQQLVEAGSQSEEIISLLSKFHKGETRLSEVLAQLDRLKNESDAKKYPEKPLDEVLKAFSSIEQGSLVTQPLSQTELAQIAKDYQEIVSLGQKLRQSGLSTLVCRIEQIRLLCKKQPLEKSLRLEIIAIAREAVCIFYGIRPYNTQVLALLGLLNYPTKFKGRIAQIRTGEGKSTVITLLAFYNACLGKFVDIISSSRYLARRDHEKYRNFFHTFGFTTSHICTDVPTQDNFQGQIIFGTNFDFEFAILRDELQEKELRTIKKDGQVLPRPFDVVIVDEVDNLLIDSAFNSAHISIPTKAKWSWIYRLIFEFVQANKEAVGRLIKGELSLQESILSALKNKLSSYDEGRFKERIAQIEPQKFISWLQSAYKALYEEKLNSDYVIKPVEKELLTQKVYTDQIVIVDRKNTGRLNEGSRWHNGLHEFLEVKHNLPIQEESLMPSSLCHPVFFGGYSTIYGLTGTVGSSIERKEVEAIYQIDTFDTPAHKPNRRALLETKILPTADQYFIEILADIEALIAKKRPTLLLFESIQESVDFATFLQGKGIYHQLLNERQAEHEDFIIARAGTQGMVTVATNTAGRGTDITLHPKSLEHGGLHVIFTFYPQNDRVEEQGFGRAARQGQSGSARMILLQNSTLAELQAERNKSISLLSANRRERTAFEKINATYSKNFFTHFKGWQKALTDDFFSEVGKAIDAKIKGLQSPLLQPIHDYEESELELNKLFRQQMSKNTSKEFSWMVFLENAKDALRHKILHNWAELFFNRLDNIQHSIKTTESRQVAYLKAAEQLYQATKINWEKYLLSPQVAFIHYVERVTGISHITVTKDE